MNGSKNSEKFLEKVLTRKKRGGIITEYKEAEHLSVLTVPPSEYGQYETVREAGIVVRG